MSEKKAGKARKQKPSQKQRDYVEKRIANPRKPKAKVAREAGYADSIARNAGQKIEESKAVKELFTALLERRGITDDLLAKRLYQGLFAMETKTAQVDGKISDKLHLVSWSERRAYLELLLKLKGHLIDKHEIRMVRTLEEILEESNATA